MIVNPPVKVPMIGPRTEIVVCVGIGEPPPAGVELGDGFGVGEETGVGVGGGGEDEDDGEGDGDGEGEPIGEVDVVTEVAASEVLHDPAPVACA